jgi:uncharacterized protein YcfL
MKKVLVPLAFATLLLAGCKASVTPAMEDGMTTSSDSSVMMEASSSSVDAAVDVDVDAGASMEATSSSEATAQ